MAVESIVTYITDMFPKHLRGGHRREILTAAYCTLSFLIGLTMVTNVGQTCIIKDELIQTRLVLSITNSITLIYAGGRVCV